MSEGTDDGTADGEGDTLGVATAGDSVGLST